MKEFLLVLAFLAVWVVLNRWVLPWLGVPTCMSGTCAVDRRPAANEALPEAYQKGDRT